MLMAILYWGNRALDPNLQEQLQFKRNSTREKPESTPLPHLMVKLEVFDKTSKIACFGSFSSTPLDLKEFSFKNRREIAIILRLSKLYWGFMDKSVL